MSLSCVFVNSTLASSLRIFLGRQTQEGTNDNEQARGVARIINHQDYDPRTNDNDIALLRLSSPVEFTTFVRPVCLDAPGSDVPAGTETWVTGWGTIGSGGTYIYLDSSICSVLYSLHIMQYVTRDQ